MNKNRITIYIVGLLILSLGLILNTKSALGVSPIISVAYVFSKITFIDFADATFIEYLILVLTEIILHTVDSLKIERGNPRLKTVLLLDALQIVLSIVFTRIMHIYSNLIPDFSNADMPIRILVLLMAIVCTGIGAAMSLNARMIPNPGDGIVQALADHFKIKVGTTKNAFDFFNICLTLLFGFVFLNKIEGIGIGTVLAMLLVGRVIALFNFMCKEKMDKMMVKS